MKLIERKNQHRRDFIGVYKCEGCEAIEEGGGYDDSNYHNRVIPAMKCNACGKSSLDLGSDDLRTAPKYQDHVIL